MGHAYLSTTNRLTSASSSLITSIFGLHHISNSATPTSDFWGEGGKWGQTFFRGKTLKKSSVLTTSSKKMSIFLDFTESYVPPPFTHPWHCHWPQNDGYWVDKVAGNCQGCTCHTVCGNLVDATIYNIMFSFILIF